MTMPAQKPGRSKQDYGTPECFIEAAQSYLDIPAFIHDYAASKVNSKGLTHWNESDDALSKSMREWAWVSRGGWGWLNPTFENIHEWVWRCLEASILGGHIAFLVPASVGSNWYRDFIHQEFGVKVLFLNGRIPFMVDKPTWLYPKDCMLVLFGTGKPFEVDVWTWR